MARDKATTLEVLAGFFFPMNNKKDEIIFGAKRAGVTWLHSFADRAELDSARERAKRLGTTLSQLLYGPYPTDPETPRRFTHEDRESATLKIQITECDEFTRKCPERQAANWGCSVEEYILDGALCPLASCEESTFLDHQTDEVVDLKFGNYVGCKVHKGAAERPVSHFKKYADAVRRCRPA